MKNFLILTKNRKKKLKTHDTSKKKVYNFFAYLIVLEAFANWPYFCFIRIAIIDLTINLDINDSILIKKNLPLVLLDCFCDRQ